MQTAGVAIRFGCWPFAAPLEELEGYDYALAVACLQDAQKQDVDFWQSVAERIAVKTIEYLGKAMKK